MFAEFVIATAWTVGHPARERIVPSYSPLTAEAWSESAQCDTNVTAVGEVIQSESGADAREVQRAERELRYLILEALTREPGLDDVSIAERIGAVPFDVSEALRAMEAEGLVQPA